MWIPKTSVLCGSGLSWLWEHGAGAESEEEGRVHTWQLSGEAPRSGTMGPTLAGPGVLERRLEN